MASFSELLKLHLPYTYLPYSMLKFLFLNSFIKCQQALLPAWMESEVGQPFLLSLPPTDIPFSSPFLAN
jgi:hypothetical protein